MLFCQLATYIAGYIAMSGYTIASWGSNARILNNYGIIISAHFVNKQLTFQKIIIESGQYTYINGTVSTLVSLWACTILL